MPLGPLPHSRDGDTRDGFQERGVWIYFPRPAIPEAEVLCVYSSASASTLDRCAGCPMSLRATVNEIHNLSGIHLGLFVGLEDV